MVFTIYHFLKEINEQSMSHTLYFIHNYSEMKCNETGSQMMNTCTCTFSEQAKHVISKLVKLILTLKVTNMITTKAIIST